MLGRHRDRRAPGRRPLHAAGGGDRDPAARRPAPADHRRRLRQARVRHRRAEDHARPRPERLRDRPRSTGSRRSRSIGEDGRMTEAGRRALRGHDRARGARGRRRRAARGGPDRPHRALHPQRAVLAALGRADRAADLAAVVHAHGRARRAGDRGRARRPRADPPRGPGAALPRLAGEHPPLVHLAPALVGPPDPRLVPRRRDLRGHRAARGRRAGSATPTCSTPGSRAGAVAVRDARLARRHARAARVLPDRRALDGARHPLPLGRPDGHDGPRVRRRHPVRRRLRALGRSRRPTGAGCRSRSAPASTRWT